MTRSNRILSLVLIPPIVFSMGYLSSKLLFYLFIKNKKQEITFIQNPHCVEVLNNESTLDDTKEKKEEVLLHLMDLPESILLQIISFLEINDLFIFSLVNKQCKRIAEDP